MAQSTALLFAPDGQDVPGALHAWLTARRLLVTAVPNPDELMALTLRGRPTLVLLDVRGSTGEALDGCRRLKLDSYTAVVPAAAIVDDRDDAVRESFEAGADEVLRSHMAEQEVAARMDALLRRSKRDTLVHPSTRLPGTVEIEAEIHRRLSTGERFAACYADLDHFKEFNDRYSYYEGDRVIRVLAKILHDVVKGVCGEDGFVGHIGGDDFLFVIPAEAVSTVCGEVVSVFDALVPYQYSEQDRRAGYFFGKDRRGQLHRVPLMTVSIGVVTNERRQFVHAAQVSELATEMKSYAKTLPGSLYTVDRRHDSPPDVGAASTRANALGVGGAK